MPGAPQLLAADLDLVQGLGERAGRRLRFLEDAAERDLELRELRVDVLLGFPAHRAGLLLGVGEHALGLLGRPGDHGLLAGHLGLLAPRLLDDALGVGAGLVEQVLAILHDPSGLLDLLGQRLLHLGDEVEDLVAVHEHRRGQRHGLGLSHHLVQGRQTRGDVHQRPPP